MADKIWPFNIPVNYVYDSDKIEVVDGLAKLKREIILDAYAHWHLNESSGLNAPDSSGNGRNGTLVNMEDEDWKVGKLNNCLEFDGVNEYVDFGDIANFERTDTFSIEGWIKTSQKGIILGREQWTPPYRGWYIGTNPAGVLQLVLTNTWGTNQLSAYQNNVNMIDDTWHHFIITYDGSSSVLGVKFYIDGQLRITKGNPSTLSGTIKNIIDCQMNGANSLNELFAGKLDEVIIYEKELTQEEVALRWNSGNGIEGMSIGDYPTDKPTIKPSDSWQALGLIKLTAFAETLGGGNEGSIRYQLSSDGEETWLYWNGSSWIIAGDDDYNDAATIQANIENFLAEEDKITFKAFLISDGGQKVELDAIGIIIEKLADNIQAIIGSLADVKAETDKIPDIKADVSRIIVDVEILKNILDGRWKIENNQMIFYKSDNETEIMRFNLFNAAGVPAMLNVFERKRI